MESLDYAAMENATETTLTMSNAALNAAEEALNGAVSSAARWTVEVLADHSCSDHSVGRVDRVVVEVVDTLDSGYGYCGVQLDSGCQFGPANEVAYQRDQDVDSSDNQEPDQRCQDA